MNSYKASYILNKHEIQFLLNSITDVPPSMPTHHILSLFEETETHPPEAIDSLLYKKLIKKTQSGVAFEPVVGLLVKSALMSDTLWIIKCTDTTEPIFVFKAKDLYIHIKSYPHIPGAWKVSPYQDSDTLLCEFDGQTISAIKRVDKNGKQQTQAIDENNSWIKDGEG